MRFDIHRRVSALARWFILSLLIGIGGGLRAGESEPLVSFINDVAPVLTKAGCNTGVCHAKAGGGQNGFQLSLLGFEPLDDYEHMALEGRGRRLSPASPEQSLLLQKVSGRTPHGGGIRLEPDSEGYAVLRRWIAQGAPLGPPQDVQLVSLEVQPSEGLLDRGAQQTLKVLARYSDDSVRDVTRLALYESNDRAMLEVSE
ncbi:MAG: S-layer protein, partial [Novipirellula sp. JB048]